MKRVLSESIGTCFIDYKMARTGIYIHKVLRFLNKFTWVMNNMHCVQKGGRRVNALKPGYVAKT